MDNILIKKVYVDEGLIELKVDVTSTFVDANQLCYIGDGQLLNCAKEIISFSKKHGYDKYVEFGEKKGNYTPAFSLKFLKANVTGEVKIEIDLEIADSEDRSHRCICFVTSDLSSIERFGNKLCEIVTSEIDHEIRLHDC